MNSKTVSRLTAMEGSFHTAASLPSMAILYDISEGEDYCISFNYWDSAKRRMVSEQIRRSTREEAEQAIEAMRERYSDGAGWVIINQVYC